MANELSDATKTEYDSDLASVFGATLSLWEATHERAQSEQFETLSACYSGMDGLMREVLRVGTMFETWSCRHVDFEALGEVWPYFMHDRFGEACLNVRCYTALESFDEADCLHVALQLRLPLRPDPDWLPAVDLIADNPVLNTHYRQFRVRSMRLSRVTDEVTLFDFENDPFDGDHARPFYSLFGIDQKGTSEHIADRNAPEEIIDLANKLVPDIALHTHRL